MRSSWIGSNLLVGLHRHGDELNSADGFGVPRTGESLDYFESLEGDGFGCCIFASNGDGWEDKDHAGGDGP